MILVPYLRRPLPARYAEIPEIPRSCSARRPIAPKRRRRFHPYAPTYPLVFRYGRVTNTVYSITIRSSLNTKRLSDGIIVFFHSVSFVVHNTRSFSHVRKSRPLVVLGVGRTTVVAKTNRPNNDVSDFFFTRLADLAILSVRFTTGIAISCMVIFTRARTKFNKCEL